MTIYTNRTMYVSGNPRNRPFSNSFQVIKAIYQKRGILGFFRSFWLSSALYTLYTLNDHIQNLKIYEVGLNYIDYSADILENGSDTGEMLDWNIYYE